MAHFHGAISGVHLHGNGESQAAGAPADPTSVTGTPTSGTTATTTWAHSGGGETGFLVEINAAGAGWTTAGTVGAGVYTYSHTGLTAATSYLSRVTALGTPNSAAVESAAWMTDTIGSGGGDIPAELVVQDATHGHTADSLALTTDSTLAVQDATHGHTADNIVLTVEGETTLTVDDANHAHTADSPTLTTDSTLAVDDAMHGHTADNLTLTPASGGGTGATAAEIWAYVMPNGLTAEQNMLENNRMMRIILAGISGKTAGLGSDTETYFGEDGTTPRIVATFDSQGNRVTVATDGDL